MHKSVSLLLHQMKKLRLMSLKMISPVFTVFKDDFKKSSANGKMKLFKHDKKTKTIYLSIYINTKITHLKKT